MTDWLQWIQASLLASPRAALSVIVAVCLLVPVSLLIGVLASDRNARRRGPRARRDRP